LKEQADDQGREEEDFRSKPLQSHENEDKNGQDANDDLLAFERETNRLGVFSVDRRRRCCSIRQLEDDAEHHCNRGYNIRCERLGHFLVNMSWTPFRS
jgi:hypothetical protein